MDLHSPKDKILLKNCIAVKLEQLKLEKGKSNVDFSLIANEMSYYENLYQILKMDDTDTLLSILNNSLSKEGYIAFNKRILTASPKEIASEYIDLTKSLMIENDVYSEKDFERLKKAFYQGNENLMDSDKTKNLSELEEEPSSVVSQTNLTVEENDVFARIESLFKRHNPKFISASEFKEFSAQFRDLNKLLGLYKFSQSFAEEGKTLTDMQISYDTTESSKLIYKTDFSLLDATGVVSQQSIQAPAYTSGYTSNYYQTLCYAYLEANQCAEMEESSLSLDNILTKMNTFLDCYKKLKEMTPKFKIKIAGHSLFYLDESSDEPSKDLDIACNNQAEAGIDEISI